jgi:hypothetical protein
MVIAAKSIHLIQYLPMSGISASHKSCIAFVSNSAWSVYNFRLDVINNLLAQGYDVVVLAPDDPYSGLLQDNGCRFVPISFDNKTKNPFRDFLFYRQLKKLYGQLKPDLFFTM